MSKEPPDNQAGAQGARVPVTEVLDETKLRGSVNAECETDGGAVSGRPPKPQEHWRDEKSRSWLTIALFCLLTGVFVVHYGTVIVFLCIGKAAGDLKGLDSIFNSALPVVSGFFGAAVAFYFKDRER